MMPSCLLSVLSAAVVCIARLSAVPLVLFYWYFKALGFPVLISCKSKLALRKLEGVHESAYLRQVNFYKILIQTHFVNF